VPRHIEPVGAHEVSVVEVELDGAPVHHAHESPGAAAHVRGESVSRIVCALHECGRQEVAHRDALADGEMNRRLADRRSCSPDENALVRPRVLERDEGGHDLRDAGDRDAAIGVPLEEDLPAHRIGHDRGAPPEGRRFLGGLRRAGRPRREQHEDCEPPHDGESIVSRGDGVDRAPLR
jgi:hypothetical protein